MNRSDINIRYPFCVVGGGLVGLIAALNIARIVETDGLKVALVAPSTESSDKRTTAMMMPSIEVLQELELWDSIKGKTAPLRTMRMVDGTDRLIRAPLTDFKSSEIDLEAFGYNVPNADMIAALENALSTCENVHRFDGVAEYAETLDTHSTVKLADSGVIESELLVAADGKNSVLRQNAGIETRNWQYPQTAIVLNFQHTLQHEGVSCEIHTPTGPFTQVPLPPAQISNNRSSLVWVVRPEDVEGILAQDIEALNQTIEEKMQSFLGKCRIEGKPAVFPLSGMTANTFAKGRTFLVGESGHVFPPIGAQGFNLGLRDVKQLGETLKNQSQPYDVVRIVDEYNRNRMADITMRTAAVDALNRSLLTDFIPVQAMRALGLTSLGAISPLRKLAMKHGMGANVSGSLFKSLKERGRRATNQLQ